MLAAPLPSCHDGRYRREANSVNAGEVIPHVLTVEPRLGRAATPLAASLNQFTETKPKSRYDRMNGRRHGGAQTLYLAGPLRPRCAVT